MTAGLPGDDILTRPRLLVVADRLGGGRLVDELSDRYGDWAVAGCDTYLSAIADLCRRPAPAVLACVRRDLSRAAEAIAGLRLAAGPDARLVLCCTSDAEPQARELLPCGADDYLLYPLQAEELDAALGRAVPSESNLRVAPAATSEEIVLLSEVLASLGEAPMTVLQRLAHLVQAGLGTRGATVVVEGAAATAGAPVASPVLTAPIKGPDGQRGRLMIADRRGGPYTPADVAKLTHYAGLAGHVLHAAARQRHLHRLAVTDECSGLPNRRYLHERLDGILARAAAERFPVTMLLFDVDDFKTYNDTYGHDAGDEILRATGALFRQHCREQDVVARYGGDEFAVVFWDAEGSRVAGSTHPGCALKVLDRFTAALRTHRFPKLGPSGVGRLTISGGLATYPWDGATREALLVRADEALLAAKRAGKNRIFLIGGGDAGDRAHPAGD
ncbi:MAG: diguanylate cyclase [Planctomycetes bacterium]|nr:diguanylate cyclase [Planctomycetota bacterium]